MNRQLLPMLILFGPFTFGITWIYAVLNLWRQLVVDLGRNEADWVGYSCWGCGYCWGMAGPTSEIGVSFSSWADGTLTRPVVSARRRRPIAAPHPQASHHAPREPLPHRDRRAQGHGPPNPIIADYAAFLGRVFIGEGGKAVVAKGGATRLTARARNRQAADATSAHPEFMRSSPDAVLFEVVDAVNVPMRPGRKPNAAV